MQKYATMFSAMKNPQSRDRDTDLTQEQKTMARYPKEKVFLPCFDVKLQLHS
jgi:hypothetical protein